MTHKIRYFIFFFLFTYGFLNKFHNKVISKQNKSPRDNRGLYYLNLSPFMQIKKVEKNNAVLLITIQFGREEIIARYNLKTSEITEFLWQGIKLKPNKNKKKPGILVSVGNHKIYFLLPEIFQIKQVNLDGCQCKITYRINQEVQETNIQYPIPDPKDYEKFLQSYDIDGEGNNDINSIYLYVHQPANSQIDSGFLYDVDNVEMDILEKENKLKIKNINSKEMQTNHESIPEYPKRTIPIPAFYRVHEEKQNDIILLKYYTYHSNSPTLILKFNKKEHSILDYQIMENDKVIFSDNVIKNPVLSFDFYPNNFSLDPNEFFMEEIIPKIILRVKSLSDPNRWKKIATIVTDVKFMRTHRINLMNIINQKVASNPNLLNNCEDLLIIVPVKDMSWPKPNLRYHLFFLYFIFKKIGQYFILQNVLETNSQINGFGLISPRTNAFITSAIDSYEELKIGENIHKNDRVKLISFPIYFVNNIKHLIKSYQTQQGGSFCCYTTIYKDLTKILYYLPNIIDGLPNPFTNSALKYKDMGISGQILEIESKWNPNNFANKLEKFFLTAFSQQSLNGIGNTIILLVEIRGGRDFGPLENEHLLNDSQLVKQFRSSYSIYFYCNQKKEIAVYVIQRGDKVDVDYKKYTDIIISKAKDNIPHGTKFTVVPLTQKQWDDKNKEDAMLHRAYFLIEKNYLTSNSLSKIKESNVFTFSNDEYLESNPYYQRIILENKGKQILADVAEDCFFHILFQISQLENTQNQSLLKKIVKLLLQ